MRVRPILPLAVFVVGLLAFTPTPRTARARQSDAGVGRAASSTVDLYYALVIGNKDYDSMPTLGTAASDARAVANVLREYYGFQTKLLVNATRSQIVTALSEYRRELGADASLLVYYAGRGHRDADGGRAFWLPSDATREDVSNWINADEITNGVRAVPARHVLVVSDSCYSGAMPGALSASPTRAREREQFLQKMSAERSRTLMASGGDKPTVDNDDDSGHSVFASALLRGLRMMEGNRFTASELFVGYVLSPVAERTGRMPTYNPLRSSGHEGGDFVFKRIKPAAAPGSCDDLETKAKLYKKFLNDYEGSPEQQKNAYEVGKEYVAKYGSCPNEDDKNVLVYIQTWLAKYEQSVREWERWKSQHP